METFKKQIDENYLTEVPSFSGHKNSKNIFIQSTVCVCVCVCVLCFCDKVYHDILGGERD